jgi:hypothetical protein
MHHTTYSNAFETNISLRQDIHCPSIILSDSLVVISHSFCAHRILWRFLARHELELSYGLL